MRDKKNICLYKALDVVILTGDMLAFTTALLAIETTCDDCEEAVIAVCACSHENCKGFTRGRAMHLCMACARAHNKRKSTTGHVLTAIGGSV